MTALAIAVGRSESVSVRAGRICTIMAFVSDPDASARFWARALAVPLADDVPLVQAGQV
jgi:hypothetical protein